jgi:hypothetical protein
MVADCPLRPTAPPAAAERDRGVGRQMGGAGDFRARSPCGRQGGDRGGRSSRPDSRIVSHGLGAGSTLKVASVTTASVPQEPASPLGEIVAGDVLDHPTTGLEGLAAARHRLDTEDMVARGAGLRDAARAGQIGGKHTADGAPAGSPP